ncbi:MAG: hypothetical protein ACLUNS_01465 [Alistipes shahii]
MKMNPIFNLLRRTMFLAAFGRNRRSPAAETTIRSSPNCPAEAITARTARKRRNPRSSPTRASPSTGW